MTTIEKVGSTQTEHTNMETHAALRINFKFTHECREMAPPQKARIRNVYIPWFYMKICQLSPMYYWSMAVNKHIQIKAHFLSALNLYFQDCHINLMHWFLSFLNYQTNEENIWFTFHQTNMYSWLHYLTWAYNSFHNAHLPKSSQLNSPLLYRHINFVRLKTFPADQTLYLSRYFQTDPCTSCIKHNYRTQVSGALSIQKF
jgi:hypothetical protein